MTHDWYRSWAGPGGTVLVVDRYRPNVAIYVPPCLRRRLGLVRSPFATRGEMRAWRSEWNRA